MKSKRVCIFGLGYIGLPTAALLANCGYEVVGVDINQKAVDVINQGNIHIVEPDLEEYVRDAVVGGRLKAFSSPQAADIYIICVPTPFGDEIGGVPQPNIDHVLSAANSIADMVKPGDLVILESTSPVGTTHEIGDVMLKAGVEIADISIAYCPERVLPGKIMTELLENDRVVGGLTDESTEAVASFYSSFVSGTVLKTDAKTAEMCKLSENSFRDVNIAFANELSILCSKEGIDISNLINLANRHPRVNILQPGPGVGGHCIAVDPWFIVARDPDNARLIRTAREVNNFKPEWVIDKVKRTIANFSLENSYEPKIACLGLSFKPDIDDLRESPAVYIVEKLLSEGCDVVVVEPNINCHPKFELLNLDEALKLADFFIVLVKHKEFIDINSNEFFGRVVLDFCGIYH